MNIPREVALISKCQKDIKNFKKHIIRNCILTLPGYILENVYSSIGNCPICGEQVHNTEYLFGIKNLNKRLTDLTPVTIKRPQIRFQEISPIKMIHFSCLDLNNLVDPAILPQTFIVFKYFHSFYAFHYDLIMKLINEKLWERYECIIDDAIDEDEFKYNKSKNTKNIDDESHYTGEAQQDILFDFSKDLPEGNTDSVDEWDYGNIFDIKEEEVKLPEKKLQFKIYESLKIK